MRCRNCDYRLWNIARRDCPECGTPFKPSDYDFVPRSVRFACPHCGRDYYGGEPRGHLEPIEFDCAGCGKHIHMDHMVLSPAEGVAEEQTEAYINPWVERRRIGPVVAWSTTIRRSMFAPSRLIRATPADSSLANAIAFAAISIAIFGLIGYGPMMFVYAMIGVGIPRTFGRGLTIFLIQGSILAAKVLVLMLVWALTAHVILKLSGATQRGFRRTLQAICYSSGAIVWMAVPCLVTFTSWIGWLWWVIGAALMMREGQRVSGWRASCAALLPPLVLLISLAGLEMAQTAALTAQLDALRIATTPKNPPYVTSGERLAEQVRLYVDNPTNPPLRHAAQLFQRDAQLPVNLPDLIPDERSKTNASAIRVGNLWFADFRLANQEDQRAAVQAAIDSLPPNIVAHRMGDVVFTWHGMDWSNKSSGLWITIRCFDPVVNPGQPPQMIGIARLDGTVMWYFTGEFPAILAAQNQLRATFDLPPLPDPFTVTQDQPATAAAKGTGSPATDQHME